MLGLLALIVQVQQEHILTASQLALTLSMAPCMSMISCSMFEEKSAKLPDHFVIPWAFWFQAILHIRKKFLPASLSIASVPEQNGGQPVMVIPELAKLFNSDHMLLLQTSEQFALEV